METYDMMPHSLLKETIEIGGMAGKIFWLLDQSKRNWKRVLTSNGGTLGEVSIQFGIFQGNPFSASLFIIILMLLSMTLNNTNYGYLDSIETPINHLLFVDDLKFYDKTERELQSLVNTVQIISKYIGLEFRMERCCPVRIKKGNISDTEDIEMVDRQRMRRIEESD